MVRALYYVQAGPNGRNAPSGLPSTGRGDLRYLRQAVANWSNVNALALSRKYQFFQISDFSKILPGQLRQQSFETFQICDEGLQIVGGKIDGRHAPRSHFFRGVLQELHELVRV
jgi:hypothetical protein